jgi:hypothetical protein
MTTSDRLKEESGRLQYWHDQITMQNRRIGELEAKIGSESLKPKVKERFEALEDKTFRKFDDIVKYCDELKRRLEKLEESLKWTMSTLKSPVFKYPDATEAEDTPKAEPEAKDSHACPICHKFPCELDKPATSPNECEHHWGAWADDKDSGRMCIKCNRLELFSLPSQKECDQGIFGQGKGSVDRCIDAYSPIDNGDCCICGKQTNNMAGNPGEWSVKMPRPDGSGKPHYYHMGCAVNRIWGCDKPVPSDKVSIDRKVAISFRQWMRFRKREGLYPYAEMDIMDEELGRALKEQGA